MIYCIKQGFINIWRNRLFSFASVVTIAACVFLFGVMDAIVVNLQHMVLQAEQTVGIAVYFTEDLGQEQIDALKTEICAQAGVSGLTYTSAEEAWEDYKGRYFADNPALAEGFEADNPLKDSAHFNVFTTQVETQPEIAGWLEAQTGVRKVTYASAVTSGLEKLNRLVSMVSIGIIVILLVVAVFLIHNTISLAYASRREEIEIMKWLGATNLFVRGPFLIEGLMIGLIGPLVPLAAIFFLYHQVVTYVMGHFGALSSLLEFLPVQDIFATLLPVGLLLGVGIGVLGSFFTIRKQLRV